MLISADLSFYLWPSLISVYTAFDQYEMHVSSSLRHHRSPERHELVTRPAYVGGSDVFPVRTELWIIMNM